MVSSAAGRNGQVSAPTTSELHLIGLADRRRELLLGGLVTAAVAGLLLAVGPAPGDAPAHLYRTLLVRDRTYVWDNFWYAGDFPLASYSLLYYLPAALFGNLPFVFAAAVVSTVLFAAIALREWGQAALWPSRLFGVLAAAPMFTGLYSYSLGFTAMLATLKALQAGRRWLAALLALLTVGFSPLAFAFLCLVLAAGAVSRPRFSPPPPVIRRRPAGSGARRGSIWLIQKRYYPRAALLDELQPGKYSGIRRRIFPREPPQEIASIIV